ncbi:MAG TPA: cysteine desulfurase family protein [bacterium]|nr:cysteine desulfurase family protein [bacterium]
MSVYLDYAATTPVDPRVLEAMLPYFTQHAGNASSMHAFGQEARAAVDRARVEVAGLLGARPGEIVFTSGATEADNLAILGVALAPSAHGGAARGAAEDGGGGRRHVITSAIEHHAVLEACHFLEQRGHEVTIVPVGASGIVDPDDIRRAVRPDTALISVMAANNEIGTLQPVAEIGAIAREHGVPFHSDATQWVGALPARVDDLRVDLLSLSGHKRYGPKGIGALYVRTGTPLVPLQRGGGHERGRRGGTENVPGIVGLGAALRIAGGEMEDEGERLTALRDRVIAGALEMSGVVLNGDPGRRLPNNVNLSVEGTDSQSLVIALDLRGVAVSAGSACSSGTLEASHVLSALGVPPERAMSAVRLTLGRPTTAAEIDEALEALRTVVTQLRQAA